MIKSGKPDTITIKKGTRLKLTDKTQELERESREREVTSTQ
jgi:hypothetical protein